MSNTEIFPLVNEAGEVVGKATRQECHSGSMLLHPVVHLHIFDNQGRLYLQKRSMDKDIQPGKWDTAVGGHVDLGENVHQALVREAAEELGIDISPLQVESMGHYVFQSSRERELVFPFRVVFDGDVRPSEETDGGRFWPEEELRQALGKEVFTPNFESEYQRLFPSES